MLEAYDNIKNTVENAPPLGYVEINSKEPIILVTDSSIKSCGYYIYQYQRSLETGKMEKKYLFF